MENETVANACALLIHIVLIHIHISIESPTCMCYLFEKEADCLTEIEGMPRWRKRKGTFVVHIHPLLVKRGKTSRVRSESAVAVPDVQCGLVSFHGAVFGYLSDESCFLCGDFVLRTCLCVISE